MFELPDSWVWDFWLADDGDTYHLFFLYASRALHDPEARHYRASIGHATSHDLINWTRVADALVRSDPPAFDDLATWTGSVVRHPDGTWFLFYTGSRLAPGGKNVQRIGYATSADLFTWNKATDFEPLSADPRWYEKLDAGVWHDEAFRDPWVFFDAATNEWHMLITARTNHGMPDSRGVVGHAVSRDLRTWQIGEPLSESGAGFGQLEVTQVVKLGDQWLLVFSCLAEHASESIRASGTTGGIWSATAEGPLGPYDIEHARLLTDDRLYSGKLIQARGSDRWLLLGFVLRGEGSDFVGAISDPIEIALGPDGEVLAMIDSIAGTSTAPRG